MGVCGGYSLQVNPSAPVELWDSLFRPISTGRVLVDEQDLSMLGNFQDQCIAMVISRRFVVFQPFSVNATEHGLISAS